MGDLIRFPLERRLEQRARAEGAPPRVPGVTVEYHPDGNVEYVQQPGWFGVRIRPPTVVSTPNLEVQIKSWLGDAIIPDGAAK